MASNFYIYGTGQVAATKEYGSWDIEVFPMEVIPSVSGVLTEEDSISASLTTSTGGSKSVSFSKSKTITAKWLPYGDYNRASAPDVCAGETVLLFKYGGEESYYWIPLFSEPDKRRYETVMYFYSNKSEDASEDELIEKGYYFVVDTRNKLVNLHTDNNDTEAVSWDFLLNTADGKFSITDSNNNSIEIDGANSTYTMTMGADITISNEGNTTITTGGDTAITISGNKTLDVSGSLKATCNGLSLTSGAYELLEVLEELCDLLQQQQHIGNMGPTTVSPTTIADIVVLKAKITAMKA